MSNEERYVNGEKDITNKQLLQSIHNEMQNTASRLTKIEDAIVQLAATQERVKMLDNHLQKHTETNAAFQNEVWQEFKEVHKTETSCLEARGIMGERLQAVERRTNGIATWKDEANIKIEQNAKTRSMMEKVAVGVIGGLIITIVMAIWGMQPNQRVEDNLSQHLKTSQEIQKLLENEHNEIEDLKELLMEHKEEAAKDHIELPKAGK